MSSIFPSSNSSTKGSLPVSNTQEGGGGGGGGGGLRRRLSSLSLNLKIQPTPAAAAASASSWSFPRSNSLRKWWDLGWGWILSRKPIFATDLEMNHHETNLLTWKHLLYKLRYEIRRFITSDHATLPQTYTTSHPASFK